jgi:hypothetical protein
MRRSLGAFPRIAPTTQHAERPERIAAFADGDHMVAGQIGGGMRIAAPTRTPITVERAPCRNDTPAALLLAV